MVKAFVILTELHRHYVSVTAAQEFAEYLMQSDPENVVFLRKEEELKEIERLLLHNFKKVPSMKRESFGPYLVFYYEYEKINLP